MNGLAISLTTERLSNLRLANKNKSKGAIFVGRRLTLLEKINLFFTISCNNEYFQVCIHEVFKRTHFGTYLKIYILVNLKMKTHMSNTIYNLQKSILEMFQYLFIPRLYALFVLYELEINNFYSN